MLEGGGGVMEPTREREEAAEFTRDVDREG
jgi:hypothetical protein